MQNLKKTLWVAAPALVALALSGCGLFKSGGSTDKYNPNAPNRTVARMVANIATTSVFNDPTGGQPQGFPMYQAFLYDTDGRQFYGPQVTLDGTPVDLYKVGEDTNTSYRKTAIEYTPGQTWTTAVQNHAATSPAALPPILINSPAPPSPKDQSGNFAPLVVQKGSTMTVTWSGGDPSQPVYIFVQELNTSTGNPSAPRLFPKEPSSPTLAPNDPSYYGAPIDNTGTFEIPAQITQRIANSDGSITTKTVTTFDAPPTGSTIPRAYRVYVVQKTTTTATPVEFSVLSTAYVPVSVPVPTAG